MVINWFSKTKAKKKVYVCPDTTNQKMSMKMANYLLIKSGR